MTRPAERRAGTGPARDAARPARRGTPPSKVRIVGGDWKRTPLAVVDTPGLRPTPDRVRETLFNWLGQRLEGWRCLDLYAGTGALGLEAASRGAARVVLVEREPRVARALHEVKAKLKAAAVEVVQADATAWLGGARDRFDLVFLDPPFGGGDLARVLPRVAALLEPGGFVYVETDRALAEGEAPLSAVPELALRRADRAGQVHYHLLHRAAPPPGA
ncbi:MAG: 16S rRNA (guanine(966)-N(2))-methyltransferase RsmD [Burkholderiales bacterium]